MISEFAAGSFLRRRLHLLATGCQAGIRADSLSAESPSPSDGIGRCGLERDAGMPRCAETELATSPSRVASWAMAAQEVGERLAPGAVDRIDFCFQQLTAALRGGRHSGGDLV